MFKDILCTAIVVDMTDIEISDMIARLLPVCIDTKQGFCFSISGYDNDPRDLWNIPEVISFTKRLVNAGFMSVLEVSTHCKELIRGYDTDELPGFGALELWLCATGKMKSGDLDLNKALVDDFFDDLKKSNAKLQKHKNTIPDGQIRHRVNKINLN